MSPEEIQYAVRTLASTNLEPEARAVAKPLWEIAYQLAVSRLNAEMKPRNAALLTVSHTPGPWTLRGGEKDSLPDTWFAVDASNYIVTAVSPSQRTKQEMEANARLIATAPELLEALKRVAGILEGMSPIVNLVSIHALIAKAEGR